MADFAYSPMFPMSADTTKYELVSSDHVRLVEMDGEPFLKVDPEALTILAERAFTDISHLLRSSHLGQLADILKDPEATKNDRFVALEMLKNAVISAEGQLPMCQDTGTALVTGYRGDHVLVTGDDGEALSRGIYNTYQNCNLRFSQLTAHTMFEESNTATNLPAQIEINAGKGLEYKFAFIQKGGGSANKAFLHQKTKAVLNPESMREFIRTAILELGTSACPPYHLAIVIGGTSAELTMKTVKMASIKALDNLPTQGNELGHAWRDLEWEAEILQITRELGIGAQFGGKYYCHDVRLIRLPRHGASCPIGIGVSCSADRQAFAKITAEGLFIEKLERDPAKFLPDLSDQPEDDVVAIDLNKPMNEILESLSAHPVETRLALSGPLIVARDIAHAKLLERLNSEGKLPDYFKDHPVYYAGPAKTPEGLPSGSFGPTTAGRMDSYVPTFQAAGGSMVMLAKGNRSRVVRESCKENGGFYLGSIGGVAAKLALESIKKVEVLEYPELGMEAVWKIEVENFPAFIVMDDKGNDFFDLS
ncbi:MAG: fumarate hydratase [Proteobacteria bacterium]|nr:fumarate hydratase [Pseudomonadota bacterium]MDA0959676.1 fumarate hydratase [Pseudomonadota bacterium]MDA1152732.1 fumarate hydratase [Pseudomonadota bacterium]